MTNEIKRNEIKRLVSTFYTLVYIMIGVLTASAIGGMIIVILYPDYFNIAMAIFSVSFWIPGIKSILTARKYTQMLHSSA